MDFDRMTTQQPTIEIHLPLAADQPAQQPTPSHSPHTMGWSERFRRLENHVQNLEVQVQELKQQVTALQQQQQPVRRERRRWYQRLTVETWGDDNQA
jgi:hypothetical protein